MSTKSVTILYLSLIVCFGSCKPRQNQFELGNSLFTKTFTWSETKAGPIGVSFHYTPLKGEIANSGEQAFFEFVIDNQLVTSNDELWGFENHSERNMGNGGTEYQLIFKGVKSPVNGLQVVIFQQVFPGSTLIREKLELRSEGEVFKLNKLNGELHFKFPGYTINNTGNTPVEATEIRIATYEKTPITFGDKKKGNHMYYPNILQSNVTSAKSERKGPVSILNTGEMSWFTAYEHASQDNLNGLLRKETVAGKGSLINDAMQGVKGMFNFELYEDDFKFLAIASQTGNDVVNVSVDVLRGGYLEGESIDKNHPYTTVWTATGMYPGNDLEEGKLMLRNYLLNQICEKPASRVPEYYYNTWGLQRNDKNKPLRGILTYDRIFEEIEYAAELGVDIFVLDDGWQVTQGIWYPNKERLSEGLAPIKERLDKHGMKLGLWYSPMGIDSTTQRFKDHYDWVVKDSEGVPILAQWNHPAFDFVSGFFDLFVEDCKNMIDQGCRFMKWDAINTFYSTLSNLQHGNETYPRDEIRARYEYLLPIYVVRAMEILTDYEPELVIEMDLTEARRVMVGLAPLSQGKLFWMNNGASWYNDYSTFRAQSMRTIANEFAGIIPLELFTYANYPHNITGNMKYNVHNSMLAGHGFWGNLELMNSNERKWIGKQVQLSKKVLPYLENINPVVIGKVGDSPEIYSVVNKDEAAGQVIAFTSGPTEVDLNIEVAPEKMLVVLNTAYTFNESKIETSLSFQGVESSVAVLILPNKSTGISIWLSTASIVDADLNEGVFKYTCETGGNQRILWPKRNGKPEIKSDVATMKIEEEKDTFLLSVTSQTGGEIEIKTRN
ncbi:alpha-galactosidase [Prolixibacteraceae bacterium Z1-6]|uniref:Alpha-galactosidase n=1 Tax=Draconibacterium aestuarii TaxID=2998507 RepID=A0A9X3J4K4_9BACT|nr:alpha-galactosidase [Prolixibacteraceae bacterium Z1-6]